MTSNRNPLRPASASAAVGLIILGTIPISLAPFLRSVLPDHRLVFQPPRPYLDLNDHKGHRSHRAQKAKLLVLPRGIPWRAGRCRSVGDRMRQLVETFSSRRHIDRSFFSLPFFFGRRVNNDAMARLELQPLASGVQPMALSRL